MRLAGLEALELRAVVAMEKVARAAAERRLAEMAHDLRAGLAAIAGYSEMLLDPELRTLPVDRIAERINRLAYGLCDAATDLAGRGTHRPARRRTSLRRVLTACAEAIEPLCLERDLRLCVDLPDEDAECDEAAVTRIAQNLLTNAARYTTSGEVRLSARLEPRRLRIDVCDTGIGIAAEDRDRIFDEFCRLPAARTLAPAGTGLGLASVRQLCNHLGGRVEIESVLGAGSTFRVYLPRKRRRRRGRVEQAQLFPD